ncbi:hypothetical protein ACN47A_08920 [Myxococcus fulvus]|uniref:hypothetical protein n=1 Tax=Myxococcus fulvus TaxID=33 RepID=UPI003B9B348C
MGIVFLDAPELGIPAGHSTLNARASDKDTRMGRRLPGSARAVPKPLPIERTQVEARTRVAVRQGALLRRCTIIVIICPNGTVIVLGRG